MKKMTDFSFKKLSKQIDLIQVKYGIPSCQTGSIMVASANGIQVVSVEGTNLLLHWFQLSATSQFKNNMKQK